MTRLQQRLDALRSAGRKALVPFVTAGDPQLAATVPVMHALVQAGADMIELGVPFSDPMADGPVIQRSSERALARGAGMAYVLDAVRAFRVHDAATPVVLMGYLNPVEIRGAAAFAADATAAGVDGMLLVDLPPEEAEEYRAAFAHHGLVLISLVSPTTPQARLQRLCEQAEGYLYYVSYAGVTGAAHLDVGDAGRHLAEVRAMAKAPVFAGFGIRDAASAASMAAHADGVVVGSALVSAMDGSADETAAAARADAFLRPLREALDGLAVPA
ncbi:MAG: tryptophan synthase subunit alpha [Xanthomonadaceae bacterium]|nr:tryptophan synthase subunit alpha [Xanthomonadaceae bacterium]